MARIKKSSVRKEYRRSTAKIFNFLVWLTTILVSLAVGFGMIGKTLTIPLLSSVGNGIIVVLAGWIVVVLTIVGVLLRVADRVMD